MHLFPYSVTGNGPAMSTAILSKGEPTLHCCIGPLALVLGHSRTGRTFLAPVLHIFSTTNPVESLPDFRNRLVNSKMSSRTTVVHFSKYFLGFNGRNYQLHGGMFSIRTLPNSLKHSRHAETSTKSITHWKRVTHLIFPTKLAVLPHLLSIWATAWYHPPPLGFF